MYKQNIANFFRSTVLNLTTIIFKKMFLLNLTKSLLKDYFHCFESKQL